MLEALAENRRHGCGFLRIRGAKGHEVTPKERHHEHRRGGGNPEAPKLSDIELGVEQAAAGFKNEALDKVAAHHRGLPVLGRDHRADARAHPRGVAAAHLDDNGVVVERQSVQPADVEPCVSAPHDPADAAEARGKVSRWPRGSRARTA